MKRLVLPFLYLLISSVCVAQNFRVVRGFVQDTDQMGMGIVGATITSPGESATAVTGQGGAFEIRVSPYARYVEASCNGYFPQKAEIDGSTLVLRLKADRSFVKNKAKAESAIQSKEVERVASEKAVPKVDEVKQQHLTSEDSIRKIQEDAERIAFEEAVREAREIRQKRLQEEEAKRLEEEEAKRLAQEEAARKAAERKQKRLEGKEAKRLAQEAADSIAFEKAVQEARERRQQRLELEGN